MENPSTPHPPLDPAACPLCGKANQCQLCTPSGYKGLCWCADLDFPEALLRGVPKQTCICRACVLQYHRQHGIATAAQKILPGDFYFDSGGLLVFTAQYHLRRGICCGSGCRHCPYAG